MVKQIENGRCYFDIMVDDYGSTARKWCIGVINGRCPHLDFLKNGKYTDEKGGEFDVSPNGIQLNPCDKGLAMITEYNQARSEEVAPLCKLVYENGHTLTCPRRIINPERHQCLYVLYKDKDYQASIYPRIVDVRGQVCKAVKQFLGEST